MTERPLLFVVSGVLPFPPAAGQNQRVRLKLEALRAHFRLGFLTFAPSHRVQEVTERLREWVDLPVVLPSKVQASTASRVWHHIRGHLWRIPRGLKLSNYVVGEVELAPERVLGPLLESKPDMVLFEYWHTWKVARALREHRVTTALDLHDLLWQGRSRDLEEARWVPSAAARRMTEAYREREETAWRHYDILITISAGEDAHVRQQADPSQTVLLAPMGVDTDYWSYRWQPAAPPRVMYYGGLASAHNQRDALIVLDRVMPRIWQERPEVELWIVGSNPPDSLTRRVHGEPRLTVTGFLPDPRGTLGSASVIVCPWTGTYGFRSRIIEALSLGVPVVASHDATAGMSLPMTPFLKIGDTTEALADLALETLGTLNAASGRERVAAYIADNLSFPGTYGRLAASLAQSTSTAPT